MQSSSSYGPTEESHTWIWLLLLSQVKVCLSMERLSSPARRAALKLSFLESEVIPGLEQEAGSSPIHTSTNQWFYLSAPQQREEGGEGELVPVDSRTWR